MNGLRAALRSPALWFLAGLSVLVGCAPVWTGQWLSAHEGPSYLFRAAEFASLLSAGEVYPRWCPDFYWGYGYPFFVFYSPGLFYLTAIPVLLGVRPDLALHGATVLGVLTIFLGGYRFCRLFAGEGPARVGAVLTTLATYRFVQYYVRGDLAEAAATSLVPWALAEGVILARGRAPWAMARLAVLLAIIDSMHTLTTVATAAALAVMGLAALARRRAGGFARIAAASLSGMMLAGAQWIPAFFERRFVSTERMLENATLGAEWRDHFVSLWQRFSPRFGFDLSVPGTEDKIAFGSSWAAWALIAIAAALLATRPGFRKRAGGLVLGWLAANLVLLAVSTPIWSLVPYVKYFQFPWRFLLLDLVLGAGVASMALDELATIRPAQPRSGGGRWPGWLIPAGALGIALACAIEYPVVLSDFRDVLLGARHDNAVVSWLAPHLLILASLVLVGAFLWREPSHTLPEKLAIAGAFAFALPIALAPMIWAIYRPMPLDDKLLEALRDPRRIQTFTIREKERLLPVTTAAQDEYRPRTAKIAMDGPPAERARMRPGSGTVVPESQHGDLRRYAASVEEGGTFEAAVLFYPGMRAAVDGVRVAPRPSDLGLVSLPLPPGRHTIDVWYGVSTTQTIGYGISALGLLATAALVMVPRRVSRRGSRAGAQTVS